MNPPSSHIQLSLEIIQVWYVDSLDVDLQGIFYQPTVNQIYIGLVNNLT